MLDGDDVEWMKQGNCRDTDPSIFFPYDVPHRQMVLAIERAKRICSQCPVIDECFDFAMTNPSAGNYGVWGGTDERQRRAIRRRHQRAQKRERERLADAG